MKSLPTYSLFRYGSLYISICCFLSAAQAQEGNKWTVAAFTLPGKIQAFEKNLGQYQNPVNNWKVEYACQLSGLTLLLTDHGLIYLADAYPHSDGDKEENETAFRIRKKEEVVHHHLCIAWPGSDHHAITEEIDACSFYFSASDVSHPQRTINHIPAFKRIVYHNLYPGIDLEFSFHPEQGIKYTLHVQSKADPNLFRMQYEGLKTMETDASGNIHLHTDLGEFIDHQPVTTNLNGKPIASSFLSRGQGQTSFSIENGKSTEGLIIDPWLTSPTTGGFVPSDIGMDAANNTYIYGMQNIFSFSKLTYLQKYNPAGTLVWTYTFNQYPGASFQSDLAVDPAGNSYVASPYTYSNSTGNQYAMVCINTGGTQSYFYNTYGNSNISETWNLAYSCNYSTLIQAGCGSGAGNTSQVTIMTPSNGNVGQQYANTTKGEVFAGTVAPNGFYYAISADSSNGGGASSGPNNDLLCCKITGATVTLNYAKHLDYKFRDYTS
ncbi:MAG TPA: hypothetical protein VNZ86_15870, partial [Bacteroidia bacterium]|nr:hypothetical protein [Bacteroidia bacterium]